MTVIKVNRRPMLIASAAIVLFMFALCIWAAGQIPPGARVPLHWDAAGNVNRYGDRGEAILALVLVPALGLVVAAVLALIPSIEPRRTNLLMSWRAYAAIWTAILLLLAAVEVVIIAGTLAPGTVGRLGGSLVLGLAGLVLVVTGNYLGKVRSNFMVGIRTPWTLTSELSWNRTHRLGGRLFVLLGLCLIVAAAFAAGRAVIAPVLLAAVFGVVATLFVYSYLVWRRDPTRSTG